MRGRSSLGVLALVLARPVAHATTLASHPSYAACVSNSACTSIAAGMAGLTGALPTELGNFAGLTSMCERARTWHARAASFATFRRGRNARLNRRGKRPMPVPTP